MYIIIYIYISVQGKGGGVVVVVINETPLLLIVVVITSAARKGSKALTNSTYLDLDLS